MSIRHASAVLLFTTLARLHASEPPPDCNANGLPDSEDVASGSSQDADGDALPDECVARVQVIAVGPGEMTLAITHAVPIRGLRVLIGYDSSVLSGQPMDRPGKDYTIGGAGFVYVAQPTCPTPENAFVEITWESYEEGGLPPGKHAPVGLGFPGLQAGECSPVTIIACARNGVETLDGLLRPITDQDGEVCDFEAAVFFRGDADGNWPIDISDPIFILGYLFGGKTTPLCLDAADAADEGRVTIASAVYLLQWLFRDGPPPAFPGPFQCGSDATPDPLGCETNGNCP